MKARRKNRKAKRIKQRAETSVAWDLAEQRNRDRQAILKGRVIG